MSFRWVDSGARDGGCCTPTCRWDGQGQIGDDGLERVTTQAVCDVLEVPQRNRRAGTYRRLAKLMTELGWAAVRVRGMTRGGYLEQVRGFARDARRSFHDA
jgi:hypothetical protein